MAKISYWVRDRSIETITSKNDIRPTTKLHKLEVERGVVDPPDAMQRGWGVDSTPDTSAIRPANELFFGSESDPRSFYVRTSLLVDVFEITVYLKFTLTDVDTGESISETSYFRFRLAPSPVARLELPGPAILRIAPDQAQSFPVRLYNPDFYHAVFRVTASATEAEGVPSDTPILGQGNYYLRPFEERTVHLTMIGPREQFWYREVSVPVTIVAEPVGGGGIHTETKLVVISGFYVSSNLLLLLFAALLQLLLLVWFIVYARRIYERRYLGRPIPPWTIPEERANLDRLKREDPRAFYVTRHFLMEEEYRSALLWFYAYKKVSAKQLKAEQRAITLREEAAEMAAAPLADHARAFARIQRRYARKLDRRAAWLQRKVDALQSRLERTFEKDYEKDHKKWEKRVTKLEARHKKPFERAHKKWEGAVAARLKQWEKPFKAKKAKHAKQLAAAKEAYAKKVKKADKATYRQWREACEDWEQEAKLARKEGQTPPPAPELFSAVVGPPELPPPFVEPPKPDLPPEPVYTPPSDLPPEPQLVVPHLATSRYARKVRAYERNAHRKSRSLELKMAAALDELDRAGRERLRAVERKREAILQKAEATAEPSFMDKVLRRTPDQIERRQHVAFLQGRTQARIREARENEQARLERVRLEGVRSEAEVTAKIIRERARLESGRAGTIDVPAARARVAELEQELKRVRTANAQRYASEQKSGAAALQERIAVIEREGAAELGRSLPPTPAATPQ